MSRPLEEWERAEVERSAAEASHASALDTSHMLANQINCGRYMNPPADTVYPLEYCHHLLGDIEGKTVLEYGCGDGIHTLVLAKSGANVLALDISPELLEIARKRLAVNGITSGVEFLLGSAHDVPLPDESVDVVFGMAILHHLDLALSAREVKRVLRRGGRAIFMEPMRSSKVISLLRGLIPYKSPDLSPYERPLTDKDLEQYADGFSSYKAKAFVLPTTNLVNVVPALRRRLASRCYRWDAAVLRKFPSFAYYSTVRVAEMVK